MRTPIVLALLAGAILRALLLPTPGTPDVDSWKIWAYEGSRSEPTSLYGVGGYPTERRRLAWGDMSGTTEYPPLALYEIAAVGRLYKAIDPTFSDSPTLTALVKVPGLIAEITFVVAMFTWGRRRLGHVALWIGAVVWLNPAIIINGAGLGYLDAQMAMPAALAVLAASLGQPLVAGALVAAAVLTKAQALFLVPVVVIASLTAPGTRGLTSLVRILTGGAMVAVVAVGPVVAGGAWPNMVQAVARLGSHNMVSGNALNVWWIATWVVRSLDSLDLGWWTAFTLPVKILEISRFMQVGYPDPKPIGALVVILTTLVVLWWTRRQATPDRRLLLAAWCIYAYSMFAAQVHENHAILVVPCLAIAAGLDRTLRPLFWTVLTMIAFNMYVFYDIGTWTFPMIERSITGVDLTVIAAFVNLGLFGWMTSRLLRARTPSL